MPPVSGRHAGRVGLVTGAAGGIGQAFAWRLAAEGASVVVADLNPTDETEEGARALDGACVGYRCDVSDPESVAELARKVTADAGRVDIVVNNAGIYPLQPWQTITFEDWRRVLAVNLDSMFLTAKAFVPAMQKAGWGRVINMTTGSCFKPDALMSHYVTSKMGVIGWTRSLATEVGEDGVTVNAIAPSLVRTPGTALTEHAEAFDEVALAQVIKRVQEPEDLVGTMSFLASDDAAFITAQTISVDGGTVRL
jgi:NAD(P)-dependent dehydrogenase (short-subunit alcohol dehydrogenase family)